MSQNSGIETGVGKSHPFLISDFEDTRTEISGLSDTLHSKADYIGLPLVEVRDLSGIGYCAVSGGIDLKTDLPYWQIVMRSKAAYDIDPERGNMSRTANSILYGIVTAQSELWKHISQDQQGKLKYESKLTSGTEEITRFVLNALYSVHALDVSKELQRKKSLFRNAHDSYVRHHGKNDIKSDRLRTVHDQIGFYPAKGIDFDNVVYPARGESWRQIRAEDLPDWMYAAIQTQELYTTAKYNMPKSPAAVLKDLENSMCPSSSTPE